MVVDVLEIGDTLPGAREGKGVVSVCIGEEEKGRSGEGERVCVCEGEERIRSFNVPCGSV